MDQNQAIETITKFIRAHWSDQKLAEVYAFNEDGKMTYGDSCGCLLGVSLSNSLHTFDLCCKDKILFGRGDHYHTAAMTLDMADMAECAYCMLATSSGKYANRRNQERKEKMSAILKAEMDRRESKHDNAIIANLQAELDAEEAACLI